ncbi:hypothetical protein [uncultured Aquimarina sp.]|uniref:LA_2272 family surface repeat-containing protein n=1 Tax=uncultured Aquimarina sp. TaxID=575652 RepID=UPI00263499E2|nr:hypothetical protein [uncultured Aquimarina sp.]
MKNKTVIVFVFVLLMNWINIKAQETNLLLIKKGKSFEQKDDMVKADPTGFYLYENVLYDLKLKSGERYNGRLVDIKKDTIYVTNTFNEAVAKKHNTGFDTIPVSVNNLDKLFLISDRSLGLYEKINLKKYDFIFEDDLKNRSVEIKNIQVYSNDINLYESGLLLTAQGLDLIYESSGQTYYYEGLQEKPKPIIKRDTYVSRKIGVVPFNVDEVNGFALSLSTAPFNDDETLKVNGFLIEVEPINLFAYTFGFMNGLLFSSDSSLARNKDDMNVFIKGLTISAVGSMSKSRQSGVTLGGVYTGIYTMRGFSLTGVHTMTYDFEGVMISGVRNQSRMGKGVQIGLFNSCKDLRGIQFGLWNKNERRSLPFINWQFSKKKMKSKTS